MFSDNNGPGSGYFFLPVSLLSAGPAECIHHALALLGSRHTKNWLPEMFDRSASSCFVHLLSIRGFFSIFLFFFSVSLCLALSLALSSSLLLSLLFSEPLHLHWHSQPAIVCASEFPRMQFRTEIRCASSNCTT